MPRSLYTTFIPNKNVAREGVSLGFSIHNELMKLQYNISTNLSLLISSFHPGEGQVELYI